MRRLLALLLFKLSTDILEESCLILPGLPGFMAAPSAGMIAAVSSWLLKASGEHSTLDLAKASLVTKSTIASSRAAESEASSAREKGAKVNASLTK